MINVHPKTIFPFKCLCQIFEFARVSMNPAMFQCGKIQFFQYRQIQIDIAHSIKMKNNGIELTCVSQENFVLNTKSSGYRLYRRNRNTHGIVIICHSNENFECKTASFEGVLENCKYVMLDFSIKTRKLLCIGWCKSLHRIKSISLTCLLS